VEIKRLFPRAQVIYGPPQLVRAHGQRCGCAVFLCQFRNIVFPRLTLAEEKHGRFGKRPAQMDSADLFACSPQSFAVRFFGAFHQPTIGDEILHAGKAGDILNLIQNHQGQNLSDPGHGLEPRKGLHVVRFSTARKVEFPRAE
jgi:hypothetical protein